MNKYGYTKKLSCSFDQAISKVTKALSLEGFGVLSKIDIKEKIKEKLGKDFNNYVIIGACNPDLSYQALQNELELGLLLPCNLIIYEDNLEIFVSSILPTSSMKIVGNPEVEKVAKIAESKLKKVIDSIN